MLCTMPSSAKTRPCASTGAARCMSVRIGEIRSAVTTPQRKSPTNATATEAVPTYSAAPTADPTAATHTTDQRTSRSPRRATTIPVATSPTPKVDCSIANNVGEPCSTSRT